ncbi:MAG TPA: hypothetical protein VNO50_13365 [Pyrinomonadaceae bacterium]|nr:hypothetical protein [Pyrinomonadaceae bacterium]
MNSFEARKWKKEAAKYDDNRAPDDVLQDMVGFAWVKAEIENRVSDL